MKKIYSYAVMLATLLLAMACSDSNNFFYQESGDAPQLLSFGFYADDNPDVLSKDYVAELNTNAQTTSTLNISIAMPALVDKARLIARFTTTDGTIVKVGDEEQTSQKSVQNFTLPVDYTITKGNVNRRCAVTVTKAMNQQWKELVAFEAYTVYGDPVLQMNPKTNVPYVAFKIRSDEDNHPVVLCLDKEHAWQYVGGKRLSHKVNNSYLDFDITSDGTPFLAYSDHEAKNVGALSVEKFDGSNWGFVGQAGLLNAQSNYVSLAALDNGEIVSAQVNGSRKGDFARNKMVISNYKDGAWNSQILGLLSNDVFMCNMAGSGNVAYVISINRGKVGTVNYGHNVLKYTNGVWTALRSNFIRQGNTTNNIAIIGITVAPNDVPYIWTLDNADGADAIRMEYYDQKTEQWFTLGGNVLPLGFTSDRNTEVALAVANNGTPYIVYGNAADQGYPYFIYLDPETQQWSAPVKIASFKAKGLGIQFSKTGVGYFTCVDAKNVLHTFIYE